MSSSQSEVLVSKFLIPFHDSFFLHDSLFLIHMSECMNYNAHSEPDCYVLKASFRNPKKVFEVRDDNGVLNVQNLALPHRGKHTVLLP